MTGKTHISIGLMSSAAVLSVNNPTPENIAVGLAVGVLGALMPDIDTSRSKVSYNLRKIVVYAALVIVGAYILMANFYPEVEKTNLFLKNMGVYKLKDYIPYNLKLSNAGLLIIVGCIIFSKFTKHRSFSHSILGLILFTVGVKLLLGNIFIYFAVGFISHMVADTFTNSGIEVFYPIKKKISLKLVHTGSMLDHFTGGLAFIVFLAIILKIK
ncbi:inner membrane protein [Clostridium acetobutylicum]|uniref:Predicted membrane-associated metal-binding protein n=1 Tax=Clostridium acetobutylicum (strain ATCC 824 / DSM 792 / JCM 1419 / IAM 19013 / LMG 5710 / NBRC 13948 / NRRL B-527 / VKM B-1787 / 2291 / W) TaxID=272562 RepID=Q97K38_CLOAB|nr:MULTISPECIES: metal-dependent hydrolase [Clostridium]AAK79057.1 Predicted membrane-associated metal-binding protein [Clostridium acetobutylicum ATCC 824]ADZ20132.1 membrane-associated metal-binding protein [Clostridium acetobutylicum EA 2018]AEI31607.1 membrane-associated metal-binding protein [Clostridium acetobutylicum DSM 1731]AWV81688.1 metal-dependent hydrolase [Clostridium acetobutylicum]MBC2395227.1 metal-dependent hydrolase [Clostridium acetobutylicum]